MDRHESVASKDITCNWTLSRNENTTTHRDIQMCYLTEITKQLYQIGICFHA